MSDQPDPADSYFELPELGMLLSFYINLAELTQDELAVLSHVNQSTISLIVNGHSARPYNSTLSDIAQVLSERIDGLSASEIFENLKDARSSRRPLPDRVPGIDTLNSMLAPYPRWFIRIAIEAMSNLIAALDAVYRKAGRL